MSNGKRKGSVLPADGLQRGDEQKSHQAGGKLCVRSVLSAFHMLI